MSCMNCVLPNLVMSIITQLIRVKIMLKFFRKQTAAEEARELYEATSNKQVKYSGLITILPIVLNQCSNAQRANTQLSSNRVKLVILPSLLNANQHIAKWVYIDIWTHMSKR